MVHFKFAKPIKYIREHLKMSEKIAPTPHYVRKNHQNLPKFSEKSKLKSEAAFFMVVLFRRFKRQREAMAVARKLLSAQSGRCMHITPTEINVITDSWERLQKSDQAHTAVAEFCIKYLHRTNYPALIELGVIDSITSDQATTSSGVNTISEAQIVSAMEQNVQFSNHVSRMESILNTMIDHLNTGQDSQLVDYVRDLGTRHFHAKRTAFPAQEWLPFRETFLQVLLKTEDRSPQHQNLVKVSWTKFIMFIVSEMKHSYCDAVRSEFSSRTTSCAALFVDGINVE